MRKLYTLLFLLLLLPLTLPAQLLSHRQGRVLVQLPAEIPAERWALQFPVLSEPELISRPVNIWAFSFDHTRVNERKLLQQLRAHRQVVAAQFDHFVEMRAVPNDPLFGQQWQYNNTGQSGGTAGADIDIVPAWDITTGGLTHTSDTIVVCVIDNGVDGDHPDLLPNLWVNHDEIPGNGIDDDANGYVDDYRGWSTVTNNDVIEGGTHGTSVTGIVGARGNNGMGVTGVNWTVKVMVVRNNFSTTESKVLAAYSYPLEQRLRYNASNGAEGAFVVATNASWGVDNGLPDDAPLWCGFYETLGEAGILNVGATANAGINVDEVGDLPTTCPSEYLIGVTNLNDEGQLVPDAAFGPLSIDLGAHGEEVFTTRGGGSYGPFQGTSAAAPHVAGAIGLLYSAPCPSLMALTKSDPGAAALLMRQVILQGTQPNASLSGRTATGGSLNVWNSMQLLLDICQACLPPTSAVAEATGTDGVQFNWVANDSIQRVDLRYRVTGSATWTEITDVESPFTVAGSLAACTDYEWQLRAGCGSTVTGYGPSMSFRTDGCCELPPAVDLLDVTDNTALLDWPAVLAARRYLLRYRPLGSTDWTTITRTPDFVNLTGLMPCTEYEFQLQTDCDTTLTDFGTFPVFRTTGCGACLDLEYCIPDNVNSTDEWIAEISIGNVLLSGSGPAAEGYADFGAPDAVFTLEKGVTYPVEVHAGYSGARFAENVAIYLDLDQNGFLTAQELLFEGVAAGGMPATGQLTIPAGAPPGVTRLRVLLLFQPIGTACPILDAQGEVEDYCIGVVESLGCVSPLVLEATATTADEVLIRWGQIGAAGEYRFRYRPVGASEWTEEVTLSGLSRNLSGLAGCGDFEVEVASRCGGQFSDPPARLVFNNCVLDSNDPPAAGDGWQVWPNPAQDWLQVTFDRPPGHPLQYELYSMVGTLVHRTDRAPIALGTLPAGVYLLRVSSTDGRSWSRRVVISR